MAQPPQRPAELYRALAEYASDVITLLRHDGTILYESPSVTRVLGYRPDDLVGRNAFELIHPDDREAVREAWRRGVEETGTLATVEYRCRHEDGTWRYLESTGRRPPEDEALDAILIHSRDVTDRRDLEQRRREAREIEALGRLVSGIAHDFNNLLTVVQGEAELLRHDLPPGDARREPVEEILEAVERGAGLTRQLLAYGRQEHLRLQVIDVNQAMEGALPVVKSALGDEVEVEIRGDPGPNRIRVDRTMARHVLLELVSNARESMPDGGRFVIEIRRVHVDEGSELSRWGLAPGHWISISYEDTGTGMQPRVVQRAIDPFFTTKEGRSGLGLSTVYGLVKQSGGELMIESEPERGTRVVTYLPDASRSSRGETET